jgi:hypothetical protein
MDAAARRALDGAKAARSDKAAAMAAIEEALRLAPKDVEVRMAAYKFHFYNHEYAQAVGHAAFCIGAFARRLGVSAEWRDVQPQHADFGALDQTVGWYLQALIAWGYCRARAKGPMEGRAAIAKAAELDPGDRFGAKRLIAVIDRGGVEVDDYAGPDEPAKAPDR